MSAEPRSWSEEACPKCKGYPGYETCECSPEVLAKREQRRSAASRPRSFAEAELLRLTEENMRLRQAAERLLAYVPIKGATIRAGYGQARAELQGLLDGSL